VQRSAVVFRKSEVGQQERWHASARSLHNREELTVYVRESFPMTT